MNPSGRTHDDETNPWIVLVLVCFAQFSGAAVFIAASLTLLVALLRRRDVERIQSEAATAGVPAA